MSFGLKNASVTYQRDVTKKIHDMMLKTMEDYVDDTLVKSAKRHTHLQDLGPILDHMEKFSLRLVAPLFRHVPFLQVELV